MEFLSIYFLLHFLLTVNWYIQCATHSKWIPKCADGETQVCMFMFTSNVFRAFPICVGIHSIIHANPVYYAIIVNTRLTLSRGIDCKQLQTTNLRVPVQRCTSALLQEQPRCLITWAIWWQETCCSCCWPLLSLMGTSVKILSPSSLQRQWHDVCTTNIDLEPDMTS